MFIKHGFYICPREEIGMYNLIRIAAKNKITGRFQRFKNNIQLNVCKILYFINNNIIIFRVAKFEPLTGYNVDILIVILL